MSGPGCIILYMSVISVYYCEALSGIEVYTSLSEHKWIYVMLQCMKGKRGLLPARIRMTKYLGYEACGAGFVTSATYPVKRTAQGLLGYVGWVVRYSLTKICISQERDLYFCMCAYSFPISRDPVVRKCLNAVCLG